MAVFARKEERVKLYSFPKDYPSNMKAQPKYKWYKPLIAVLVFAILGTIFNVAADLVRALYSHVTLDPVAAALPNDAYLKIDYTDPIGILLLVLSIAVMIPAAAIAMKVSGLGGLRTLSSVEGRFRWDLVKKIALPIVGLTFALLFGSAYIEMALGDSLGELSSIRFAPLALIAIVLFVPFQCAAEEYAFRGVVMQTAGSWIPAAIVSCLIQAIFFGMMHGYNTLGNIGILINGFIWGWLTIKTGGIEASTCLHAANNVCALLLSSLLASATVSTSVSIGSFVFEIAFHLALAGLAYHLCKKNGYIISDNQPKQVESAEAQQA